VQLREDAFVLERPIGLDVEREYVGPTVSSTMSVFGPGSAGSHSAGECCCRRLRLFAPPAGNTSTSAARHDGARPGSVK
jgi:hypothetical protein